MNIRIFLEEKPFLETALNEVRISLSAAQPEYHLALSGGTTPAGLYRALAEEKELPWEKINLWQVDERCVPPSSNDSNRHLVEETLLKNLSVQPRAFNAFNPKLPPEQAAKKYEKLLRKKEAPFDLTILGIGGDGHTASLFPHSPALAEQTRLAIDTTTEHHPVRDRLTLTFPPILESKRLLVLLKGPNKAEILEKMTAKDGQVAEYPSRKLIQHPALMILFLNA